MLSFRNFALLLTLIVASSSPQARATGDDVLVLGDSLGAALGVPAGEGWVDLLQQALCTNPDDCRIINASISGDTTGGGRARIDSLLARYQPEILVLELGGNDGLRGYPLTSIRSNLAAIIDAARDASAEVLLIGIRIPPNYGAVYTEGFYDLYADLATSYQIDLVPFLLDGVATDASLMQADGIHPTAAAQPRLAEIVLPYLSAVLNKASSQAE